MLWPFARVSSGNWAYFISGSLIFLVGNSCSPCMNFDLCGQQNGQKNEKNCTLLSSHLASQMSCTIVSFSFPSCLTGMPLSLLHFGSFQSWLSPSVVHGELKMLSSPSVAVPSLNLLLRQIPQITACAGVQNKLVIIWWGLYHPDLGNSHSTEKVVFPACARKDGNIRFYLFFQTRWNPLSIWPNIWYWEWRRTFAIKKLPVKLSSFLYIAQ